MNEPTKEIWDLSDLSDYVVYLVLGGIALLIGLLLFHSWSRLLWLSCGGCFGLFFGFVFGNHYTRRAIYSKIKQKDSTNTP
jgi:hypothetical protein